MTIPVYLHKRFQEKLDNSPCGIKTKVNYVINKLEDQTYHDVKKLAPYKDLYRARVDQGETRILFYVAKEKTTKKKVLLVVDLITKHAYQKSIYLKHSIDIDEDVLQRIKIQDIVPDMELEDKLQNGSTTDRKLHSIVISKNKAIILTDDQEKVLETQLPAIVHGIAGSGKTSVALESIRKIVADLEKDGVKEINIAYISLSENLVQEAKKAYWNTEEQEDSNKDQVSQIQVEFLTYDSFLKRQTSFEKIRGKKPIDRKVFLSWFNEISKKGEYKKYKHIGDQIFEEFSAVITGSDTQQNCSKDTMIGRLEDNYYKRGVKQSIFTTNEDRNTIFKFYKQWKDHISCNKEYYDSNIITHEFVHADVNKEKIYDAVVVDEAQDLTLIQLQLILGSIKNTSNFLLCCDENQVIHPSFFSQRMLDAYFYDKVNAITKHSLDSNYRNSPMVKQLINGVLHVKEKLFPVSSKKQSNMQLNGQSADKQVISTDTKARYLTLTDKHKEKISNTIQTGIKLVVIVPNDNYKEKAQQIFPSLLVFNVYEIKGLEYPHVILFNFFLANKQQCDKILSYIVANSSNNLEINRAETKNKHDKSFEESKFYVNALYVAATRGMKTVSIIEAEANIKNGKALIDYLDKKMYLTTTDDIEKILEGNMEDSLSDLKNEALKLASRGNIEQARTIVRNIRKKYISGNNKENKQEAKKYIQEIEDRMRSDSDVENNQSTNYAESDNYTLKKQVNEPWVSASHDNFSSTSDHSTGAIPKKHTLTALQGLPSTQTSAKSGKKQQKKDNKKTTTAESKTDRKKMISDLNEEWTKVFIKGCTEEKILDFLKENLDTLRKMDQEFRNQVLIINGDENADKNKNDNLLHYALKLNCKGITKFVITNKLFDVNSKADDGRTPLHIATTHGIKGIDTVRLLIDKGAEVYAKADDGSTALHFIAHSGSKKVAELLLKKGAEVNATKNKGITPLHIAAHYGYTELAKLLLNNMTNVDGVNIQEDDGTTPLHITAYNGHTELAKLLLDNRAEVNATKSDGTTPLHIAAHNGNTELAKLLLLYGAEVNATQNDDVTPLHFASTNGHIELAKLLLNNGAKVDAKANDGRTPLHFAAHNGHTELAKLLLDNMTNIDSINVKAHDGVTPLHFTAYNGHTELAKLLLDNMSNIDGVNIKEDDGTTPLHIVAQNGNTELAKLFLLYGAEVNATQNNGVTPLHFAAQNGHIELAKLLLLHRAKVDSKAHGGVTPLHVATQSRHTELAKLLLLHRANVNATKNDGVTPLLIAADNQYMELAKLLLHYRAEVNVRKNDGVTPLHFATYNGHIELAKLLLHHRAEVNARKNDDITSLHVAAHNGHIGLAKLLLLHGAKVNATQNNGVTPLHFAAQNGHMELAKLLLANGAKVDAKAHDGVTPLHIVAHNGHMELAKLLVQYKKYSANINVVLSSDKDKEDEQLITKYKSQIFNRLQMSKNLYEAVKSFWLDKILEKDTNKTFIKITKLLYNQNNNGILLDVYYTVGKNNTITLATKCKDQTLLQLLLDYAVKIGHIKLIRDLLGIKKDNDRKLLVGTKCIRDLLSELKKDEQKADAERKEKIIEVLTAAIDNLPPTNISQIDSNSASEDSGTGESKLYHKGMTENTDSDIEIEMNDNDEPAHVPLGRQSQNWHYDDNVLN